MTVLEIKEAACGKNANGQSNSVTLLGVQKTNVRDITMQPDVVGESSTVDPIVNIKVGKIFSYIDLEFIQDTETLKYFYILLEKYLEEGAKDTEAKRTDCFLTILPFSLKGQYYITAINPVFWSREPDIEGGKFTKLRMVFYSENIRFDEAEMNEELFKQLATPANKVEEDNYEYELYGDDPDLIGIEEDHSMDYMEEDDEIDYSGTKITFIDTDDDDDLNY